jgi:tetratricopeptide (TPR) repeat protein
MMMRKMRPFRLFTSTLFFACSATAILSTGCASQRPVEQHRETANWCFERGDYMTAAEHFQPIVERYPGDWEAQYRLGLCYLELERPVEARRALEVAHTRKPQNEDIADALADAMFQCNDPDQLFAFVRQRAESLQTVRAWHRVAKYATLMRDPDSTKVALDTAIALDEGKTVEPYLLAADFNEQLGNLDEAVRRLRQAYGIDPLNEDVNQRLRDLGEIPGPTIALAPGR